MDSAISKLLSELAKDPSLQEAFKEDPDAVMDKYGVPADQKATIQNEILKASGGAESAPDSDGPDPSFAC